MRVTLVVPLGSGVLLRSLRIEVFCFFGHGRGPEGELWPGGFLILDPSFIRILFIIGQALC